MKQFGRTMIVWMVGVATLASCQSGPGEWAQGPPSFFPERLVEIRRFEKLHGRVCDIALDAQATRLVTAEATGGIHVWDFLSGRELQHFQTPKVPNQPAHMDTNRLCRVVVSADAEWIASTDDEHKLRVWPLREGAEKKTHSVGRYFKYMAIDPKTGWILGPDRENFACLWDPASGRKKKCIAGKWGAPHTAVYTEDGEHLLLSCQAGTYSLDRTGDRDFGQDFFLRPKLVLLSRSNWRKVWEFEDRSTGAWQGYLRAAVSGRFRLIAGGGSGRVTVWRWGVRKPLWDQSGFREDTRDMAFSPDGHYLVTAHSDPDEQEGKIRFWSVKDGTLVRTLSAHQRRVERILFTPDGRYLVTGGGYEIRVWGEK